MGRWITTPLPPVPSFRQLPSLSNDHRADGNLTCLSAVPCLVQREFHPTNIFFVEDPLRKIHLLLQFDTVTDSNR